MTTRLINPADAQLNAAFAEHVAGWSYGKEAIDVWTDPDGMMHGVGWGQPDPFPPFTQSADAVLPWLEKMPQVEICLKPDNWVRVYSSHFASSAPPVIAGEAISESFAKAAVIALLRAHGVEVEFTHV